MSRESTIKLAFNSKAVTINVAAFRYSMKLNEFTLHRKLNSSLIDRGLEFSVPADSPIYLSLTIVLRAKQLPGNLPPYDRKRD